MKMKFLKLNNKLTHSRFALVHLKQLKIENAQIKLLDLLAEINLLFSFLVYLV